jgi:hypothetical protein
MRKEVGCPLFMGKGASLVKKSKNDKVKSRFLASK